MDANTKKTTLRMIPYGLYVLTAAHADGRVAAATINWVTQASFEPPLIAIGVKADSGAHSLIKDTKAFALNVLGKGQQGLAFTFFKPAEKKGDTISGEPFRPGTTGAPILTNLPAFVECTLEATVEKGDHSVFVGRVVEVGLAKPIDGRADDATLWLKELLLRRQVDVAGVKRPKRVESLRGSSRSQRAEKGAHREHAASPHYRP